MKEKVNPCLGVSTGGTLLRYEKKFINQLGRNKTVDTGLSRLELLKRYLACVDKRHVSKGLYHDNIKPYILRAIADEEVNLGLVKANQGGE